MKTAVLLIASCFFLLFVLTTFVPFPGAIEEARAAGFDADDIATGLQITFERRFFFWGATLLELGLLCLLALTCWSRRWADRFLGWTGQRRIPAVLAVGLIYLLLHEILFVPLGVARWYHARAWGMMNLDLADWFRERYLAYGINLIGQVIVVVGFYSLLILLPRVWWLIAPLGLSTLGIAYAFLAPIWINPLFNTFTPLEATKWSHQQPRVRDLIDKAKVPVQEVLVMNGSRQSDHANAYFTGFGPTRRIVLYDTLLKNHTDAEIESILGHELGHWQQDHINKGILLATLAALLGCFVLDRCLRAAIGRAPWHLQSTADPAGLPLVMLLIFLGSWITMPVTNAVTRYFERQADTASLELAGQTEAFIAAELKLAKVNKSNVAPTPWNVWLFSSHPPTVDRIRMAREWKQ